MWGDDLAFRSTHDVPTPGDLDAVQRHRERTATGEIEVLRNLVPDPTLPRPSEGALAVRARRRPSPPQRPDRTAHRAAAATFDPGDVQHELGTVTAGADGTIDSQRIAPSPPDGTGIYALAAGRPLQPPRRPAHLAVLRRPAPAPARAAGDDQGTRGRLLPRAPRAPPRRPAIRLGRARDLTTVTRRRHGADNYITNIAGDDRRNAAIYFPYLQCARPAAGRRGRRVPARGIDRRRDGAHRHRARRLEGAGRPRRRARPGVLRS